MAGTALAGHARCSTDNGSVSDQRTPAKNTDSRALPLRELVLAAIAVAMGAGIAWVDTRPTWDDTGVTVGTLLLAAGFAAAVGLRWWAAALLVAAPILVAELRGAGWGVSASLAFTGAGSLLGVTMRRILGGGRVR
jgi:hypothetical protein